MHDLGVVRRIRSAVEAFVPWYDPDVAHQQHVEVRKELAKSRATRAVARKIMGDVARRYERYDGVVGR